MKEDILLGIERLKSYENKSEHYKNLNLIGEIMPKIALLELILRNLLDFYLSEENKAWIFADELKAKSSLRQQVCQYNNDFILPKYT